jgi:two-component system, chemotaxis family, protein-glutamate methylesterase/glutaminase
VETPPDRLPLVVIGGSAGSIGPLTAIVRALPTDLPAAVCVVVHMPDDSSSGLATLLARGGRVQARFADDGDALSAGSVAVAPPGNHLMVQDGRLRLSSGAHENGSRPAIDPLFRTAAKAHGPRVVSVVLSGTLDDGAAGTVAVRRSGGVTIAEDPDEASFGDMPRNAIATGAVAEVLPASAIGPRVAALVAAMLADELAGGDDGPPQARERPPADLEASGDHPLRQPKLESADGGVEGPALDLEPPGSPYSCPACGGVLYERPPDQLLCRLGHRYSAHALSASQEEVIDDALWTALRTLEESASLASRVRDRASARGDRAMAHRFEARRAGAEARAGRIRALLLGKLGPVDGLPGQVAGRSGERDTPGTAVDR